MSTYAPFRHPAFRAFVAGRVLTVLGTQMLSVAVGWQIYALTNDPMDLGLVGLVLFLPQLLLFPVAGMVADRGWRNLVVTACYTSFLVAAALLAWLSWSDHVNREAIFAALLFVGIGRTFGAPAVQSLLPQLVPREDYPRAVSWNSSAFETAVITGPALGGLVYGQVEGAGGNGAVGAYVLAGVLLLGAIVTTLLLPWKRAEHPGQPPGVAEALDGVRFIWSRKILLSAITLDLFAVLFGGAVALLPIYARDVLDTGPEGMGILRAAPAVGALLMAVTLAHRPLGRRLGVTLYVAVAVFGVATLVFALSETFWLSVLALFVTGAADEVSVFIRMNVVQLATPNHVRGRVSAAEFVFIGASNELGQFESGVTADWFGAVPAAVLGGVGTLVTVAVSAAMSRQLRNVDRLEDLRPD